MHFPYRFLALPCALLHASRHATAVLSCFMQPCQAVSPKRPGAAGSCSAFLPCHKFGASAYFLIESGCHQGLLQAVHNIGINTRSFLRWLTDRCNLARDMMSRNFGMRTALAQHRYPRPCRSQFRLAMPCAGQMSPSDPTSTIFMALTAR